MKAVTVTALNLLLLLWANFVAPGLCAPSDHESLQPGKSPEFGSVDNDQLVVSEINIAGDHKAPTDEIRQKIKTKPGDVYVRARLVEDLQAIDSMGCFDSHKLVVDPKLVGKDRVSITIHVVELPTRVLRGLEFVGDQPILAASIVASFAGRFGAPLNSHGIDEISDQIERQYRSLGFTLAKVRNYDLGCDGNLKLTVDEGVIDKVELKSANPGWPSERRPPEFASLRRNSLVDRAVVVAFWNQPIYNEQMVTGLVRRIAGRLVGTFHSSFSASDLNPGHYIMTFEYYDHVSPRPNCFF